MLVLQAMYEKLCGMSISRLPLAYTRRRQPPSYGHCITFTRAHAHTFTRYWHVTSII
jgi:hypothetical protein